MRPKHLILACLLLVIVGTYPLAASAAVSGNPSIVINGTTLPSDVPALVAGDHVLVPLRGVFEQFGAQVSFDPASGISTASLGGTTVAFAVGSTQARVNGVPKTMDVAAREVAGRVMIPVRFVAQALGVSVGYDEQSNTVVIVSGQKQGSFAAYAGGPVYSLASRIAPTVESERPGSGEIVGSQYPSIYARFNGGSSAVNPSTVQIEVDGIDVTDQSTISSAYLSYTPSTALLSGLHNVHITGQSDGGAPFEESWSFRVDAGSSSDDTVGSYGGAGFGFPGFGFGSPRFHRSHFSPPGFSVFTPGQLFFVSGGVIEVIFVSRFFPFGSGFFTISGCPGQFALTPWLGNPGFFWGFMQVPFGLSAHNATIAAHFTSADGHKVTVDATAPLEIEGQRRSLPPDLRYAMMPHLVNRPSSPQHLVVFDRTGSTSYQDVRMSAPTVREMPGLHAGWTGGNRLPTSVRSPATVQPPALMHEPVMMHVVPVRPLPIIRPAPVIFPAMHGPSQWQVLAPARAPMPAIPAKPH